MSTSPLSVPNNYTPKSFWQKPEGTPGKLLLGAIALGGLYAFWMALPFLLGIVWGAVSIGIGLAVLVSMYYIVTNKTLKCLVKNVFQSLCRGMAMVYTTIDPIGILKNQLDDMRAAKKELAGTVQRFAGSDKNLRMAISGKRGEVEVLRSKVEQAEKMLSQGIPDATEKDRVTLKRQTYLEQAGMLMTGVDQLQALETQTAGMLDKFRHWSEVSDAKIERTANRLEFLSFQRKTILDAQGTLNVGKRLLSGDNEQLALVDASIEFLTEETARTLGEIEEFNRDSDKMLTDISIENGANAEVARKKFADFGAKLDQSASLPAAVDKLQLPSASSSAPFAQVTGVTNDSYSEMFSSKK